MKTGKMRLNRTDVNGLFKRLSTQPTIDDLHQFATIWPSVPVIEFKAIMDGRAEYHLDDEDTLTIGYID